MQKKRIQNVISESRWTPSVVFPLAFILWGVVALHDYTVMIPMAIMAIATLLVVELNNSNALIRVYSRMVSCSFLALSSLDVERFGSIQLALILLCIVGFFSSSFKSYQHYSAPGRLFYAFLCIGVASVVWVQILYFVPILWILIATNILSFSFRNFVASILGLICPYWFLVVYAAATNNFKGFIAHFTELAHFGQPLNFLPYNRLQLITTGFVLLCSIIGIVHTVRQKRSDSIRTRLFMQAFITVDITAIVFLFLQPQHLEALLSVIIVCTSPLLGHFFALTKTKFTNWMFLFLVLSSIVLTTINLWNILLQL